MPKRVVFEVRYVKDADAFRGGAWQIFHDGSPVEPCFSTKAEAVKAAVGMMKLEQRSELKIKNKKGRIQSRRTWPRSSDPKGRG